MCKIASSLSASLMTHCAGQNGSAGEFGEKIETSLVDGYARIEKLGWDAFNEGGTLQDSVERFRADTGHYPARILASVPPLSANLA